MNLPLTHFETTQGNDMEQLLMGRADRPFERATSLFFYERQSPYARILHDIKYNNVPRMGRWLAAYAARRIAPTGFFDGITAIVPVPLHVSKLAKRGYNQSRFIAQGIADVTGIPLVEAVKCVHAHGTQTRRGSFQRWLNASDAYRATSAARALDGAHVLLVDDVITTGATIEACAIALHQLAPTTTVSVFTLAAARLA